MQGLVFFLCFSTSRQAASIAFIVLTFTQPLDETTLVCENSDDTTQAIVKNMLSILCTVGGLGGSWSFCQHMLTHSRLER